MGLSIEQLQVLVTKLQRFHKLRVYFSHMKSDTDAQYVLNHLFQRVTAGDKELQPAADIIINTWILQEHECLPECSRCAFLDCVFGDDMHHHHDGCPSCYEDIDSTS